MSNETIPPRPKKLKVAIKRSMTDAEAVIAHKQNLCKYGMCTDGVSEEHIWLQRNIDEVNRERNKQEIAEWDEKYGKK